MVHGLLPRPKEGGCRTLRAPGIAAYGGPGGAVFAEHLLPNGAGEYEQVVVPPASGCNRASSNRHILESSENVSRPASPASNIEQDLLSFAHSMPRRGGL